MPQIHLKQPTSLNKSGFTYNASGLFTKSKERLIKFIQTGNAIYVYRNDLDKACFQHDMAYDRYKELTKTAKSNKVLRDKAFKITSNPKCN